MVCRASSAREAFRPPWGVWGNPNPCLDRTHSLTHSLTHTHTDSLPALHDPGAGAWTTGFTSIVAYLSKLNPAWALDASLSPAQRADTTAYTAFLTSTAAPLLALSLYVSSANWAGTTRPAYSTVLPFPLTWTEPLAVRRHMCDVAAHLGLSDLNIDDDDYDHVHGHDEGRPRPSSQTQQQRQDGFLKIPESLRPRPSGVRAALSPEQTALFRLEGAGRACLGVLADLLKSQHDDASKTEEEKCLFFFGGDRRRPTSLDCLAFGYLALMLVPEVPRPWLRDLLRRRYDDSLCVFVDRVRDELFGGDVTSLPWRTATAKGVVAAATAAADDQSPWRVTRFARGVVKAVVPRDWVLGEACWPASEKKRFRSGGGGGVLLTAIGSSVAGFGGIVGSVLLYHRLSPFGAVFYRWEMQRRSLGAAGALFGI